MPDVSNEAALPYCVSNRGDGTLCDLPGGHQGDHRRRPLYDEHEILTWGDECGCPGCRIGLPCEWHLRKCAHDRVRSCDSRCNDGAAHPWHRGDGDDREYAHGWCLPQQYTKAGWKRGPDLVVQLVEVQCACCGGLMDRWPR